MSFIHRNYKRKFLYIDTNSRTAGGRQISLFFTSICAVCIILNTSFLCVYRSYICVWGRGVHDKFFPRSISRQYLTNKSLEPFDFVVHPLRLSFPVLFRGGYDNEFADDVTTSGVAVDVLASMCV